MLVQSGLDLLLDRVALLNCLLKCTKSWRRRPARPKRQFLGRGSPLEAPRKTALVREMPHAIVFFGQLPAVGRGTEGRGVHAGGGGVGVRSGVGGGGISRHGEA